MSRPHGVSSDGSVVVGTYGQAYRWTETDGFAGLGYLPGSDYSEAFGVSRYGAVVVGGSAFVNGLDSVPLDK